MRCCYRTSFCVSTTGDWVSRTVVELAGRLTCIAWSADRIGARTPRFKGLRIDMSRLRDTVPVWSTTADFVADVTVAVGLAGFTRVVSLFH